MTQAQLAGSDFTTGLISLVETGRSRVSIRAAEIFARRLGVGLAELMQSDAASDLELEATAIRAEAELRAGRAAGALELATSLERVARGTLRGRLLRIRGRALTQIGRARDAVAPLDEARRIFEVAQNRDLRARTLYDLAVAHSAAGGLGDALVLATQAEQAMLNGDLVDRTLELEILAFLAAVFVSVGDVNAADLRAERAKKLAEDVADPAAIATLYESLAATRQEQGDYEAALAYAQRSLAAYEQMANARAIGSAWNTIGWVYTKRRQLSRAADALQRATKIADAESDGRLMAYVLQTQAELAIARGNFDDAVAWADKSASHAQASDRARALSLLVKAEALGKSSATLARVNKAFADAIAALESHGQRQLARAYQSHFEALNARGHPKEAVASAQRALQLLQPSIS
jgi:tetratricopeptide (TPR) repeat protein